MDQDTVKEVQQDTSLTEGLASGADGSLLPQAAPVVPAKVALGGGAYEAAERFNREMASWNAANRSADADLLPSKDIIDARAKDIARNDAYIENGIEKYKDSVVGAKFTLNVTPDIQYLSKFNKAFDQDWLEEFQDEVESLWNLAAESESHWIDAQRTKTATEIVRLGLATHLIQGEVFISSEWLRRQNRPFNTAFLMIDPTRVDDPDVSFRGETVRKNIRRGVRLNAQGAPVGYFIANEHPHDFLPTITSFDGTRYQYVPRETPWGRTNILHLFEEKRIGQTRGVSKMVSAMREMKMRKQFNDVMLQNAIVNATYAAAIESELPTEQIFEMMGGTGLDDADAVMGAVEGYTGGYLGALSEYLKNSNGTMLNGVKIPHLFPGTKLNLMPAGQGGPLGTEFEKSLIRYLAANMNMSYEQLSGDFAGVNYSTLKGAINETQRHMDVVKRNSAERIMNTMYRNWLEEMITTGSISSMPKNAPDFIEGMCRDAYSGAEWFNSGRGQIDELKETQAASLRRKSKLSTLEQETGRLGKDWRKVIDQIAREKAYAEKKGVNLDFEDNSMNAASGTPREKSEEVKENDGE